MPLKPREMEKIILADGWVFKEQNGSHRQYVHPTKEGKVTIHSIRAKSLTDEQSYLFGDRRGLNKPLPFLQTH